MSSEEIKSIGKRIKTVRQERGVTVEALADKAGCSSEFLEWVEGDQVEAPVALLIQLAKALRLDSSTLLTADDSREQRLDEAAKRTKHYSYKTLTPSEEETHLMAFSVTIPPKTSHEGVGYQHEGEEFVYVISGEVELTVDNDVKLLKARESKRFNSNLDHHLSNPSDKQTELLVILYIP